jgi:hypothetical protein
MLGGVAQLERDFGEAAAAGGLLSAIVGGALGVAVLAVFLSQSLRDGPAPPSLSTRERVGRTLIFSLLALLGIITYFVVVPQ